MRAPVAAKMSELRAEIAEIEERRPLTRAQVIAILCRQAGGIACGCGCGETLDPVSEGVIDEHRVALGLTGTNALPNREFWRKPCSAEKTKRDQRGIAAAKRIAAREDGTRRERKPIPQRPDPWPAKGSRKLQGRGFPASRPFVKERTR